MRSYNELSTNKLAHYFVGRVDDRVVALRRHLGDLGGFARHDARGRSRVSRPRASAKSLLLRLIDEAIERGAAWMTLEVRESNAVGAAALSQVRFHDGDDAHRLLQRRQRKRADHVGRQPARASSIATGCACCATRCRASREWTSLHAARAAAFATHLGQEHRYAHSVRVARCAEHARAASRRRCPQGAHRRNAARSRAALFAGAADRGMRGARHCRSSRASARIRRCLHARLGAALARELFGVEDADVLSAIEKHTIGADADVAARLRRLSRRFARARAHVSRTRRALGARARLTRSATAAPRAKRMRRCTASGATRRPSRASSQRRRAHRRADRRRAR